MKERVRAIIFDGGNIILMKRKKDGPYYYVFPGGLVEKGESKEEALKRECKEELGIDIKVLKLLEEQDLDLYEEKQKEYFYLCEKKSGILGTGDGPEFTSKKGYWGSHEVALIPRKNISSIDLLPENIKKMVLKLA